MINPSDIGNTLLRGTDGSEMPPEDIPRRTVKQIIIDAFNLPSQATSYRQVAPLKCPKCGALWLFWPKEQSGAEMDTISVRMRTCSFCDNARVIDLKPLGKHAIHPATQPEPSAQSNALQAERDKAIEESNAARRLTSHVEDMFSEAMTQITQALYLQHGATLPEIIAECENLSRLAQRASDTDAAAFHILTFPNKAAKLRPYTTLDEAKRAAEEEASARGRASVIKIIANVDLQPVWSDAK